MTPPKDLISNFIVLGKTFLNYSLKGSVAKPGNGMENFKGNLKEF